MMSHPVIESDWKYYSKLRRDAIDRFFVRELARLSTLIGDEEKCAQDRYHLVAESMEHSEWEREVLFGTHSRSTMFESLTRIYSKKLITPEEFQGFTEATREIVERMADCYR